jgi:hypothetical protein
LSQDDKMTQMPIINNIATEIWKVKEVKEPNDVFREMGQHRRKGHKLGNHFRNVHVALRFKHCNNDASKAVKIIKETMN